MREITITRKKKFAASLAGAFIILDGISVAKIKNGKTVKLTIDENAHEIYAQIMLADGKTGNGNVLCITAGTEDITLELSYKFFNAMFFLASQSGINCVTEKSREIQSDSTLPVVHKNQTGSYITGITVSLLLIGLSIFLYTINETSLLGLIAGSILSIAGGVVIIAGGFWFFIIPLPFIDIGFYGCLKPNQSKKRKIVFGILSFLLPVSAVLALFLFRNS